VCASGERPSIREAERMGASLIFLPLSSEVLKPSRPIRRVSSCQSSAATWELRSYSTENPVHCQALTRQKTADLLDRVDL
jgi:hypothetical protein